MLLMSQQFESVFNLYSLSVQTFMFQISSCFTISTENDKKEAVSLSYWRLLWQVTRLTTPAHWRETTSYATCLGQSIRHSGVFSQTWPPCPSFLTSMQLLVSSSTPPPQYKLLYCTTALRLYSTHSLWSGIVCTVCKMCVWILCRFYLGDLVHAP